MRNIKRGDIVRIVLDHDVDEDIFAWGEDMMHPDDIIAVWQNNQCCAIVEESGRDWVNLILQDGRRITNLDTRRIRFVSAF